MRAFSEIHACHLSSINLIMRLTYPALQSGAGGGLDHIRWVHSHVEAQHQRHAHSLHLGADAEHNSILTHQYTNQNRLVDYF